MRKSLVRRTLTEYIFRAYFCRVSPRARIDPVVSVATDPIDDVVAWVESFDHCCASSTNREAVCTHGDPIPGDVGNTLGGKDPVDVTPHSDVVSFRIAGGGVDVVCIKT